MEPIATASYWIDGYGHRADVPSFPGRLGIMHRDLPEMVARGYADVAFTWYHLVSYWTRIFPNHFALVPVRGGEPFFTQIAFGRVSNPLRPGWWRRSTSSSLAGRKTCIPDTISRE